MISYGPYLDQPAVSQPSNNFVGRTVACSELCRNILKSCTVSLLCDQGEYFGLVSGMRNIEGSRLEGFLCVFPRLFDPISNQFDLLLNDSRDTFSFTLACLIDLRNGRIYNRLRRFISSCCSIALKSLVSLASRLIAASRVLSNKPPTWV
jgi:hypothetical protein